MSVVRRLNHAVLYVSNAVESAGFYSRALGLSEVNRIGDGAGVFLRAEGSDNDHDLGLFTRPGGTPAQSSGPGLYHLAWELATLDDLVAVRDRLISLGSLVGESDHGATKSLYAKDPDGIEFEVMWQVPLKLHDPERDSMRTGPLDLDAEQARFGGSTVSRTV